MSGIRRLARELRSGLAAADPARYSGTDSAAIAEELARTEKACAAARVRFAARAVECGEHRRRGHADASGWLAAAAGISTGQASAELETLESAADRPELKDALIAGEVSLAQAGEIASTPAEHQSELLDLARTSGLRPVRDRARTHRLAAIDVEELHARRQAARTFTHGKDGLGMITFRGALPPEVGVKFVNRLDREADRIWREAHRAGDHLTREQCAADALVRMVNGTTKSAAGSTDLVFVVDLAAWTRGHTHPGEVCHVLGGGPVPMSVVRQHAASAFVKVAFHDGTKIDTIVHYGRRRPALLQTVLDLGDPPAFDGVACADEGCDRRYGLEWDHVDPVANGGPTARDNLEPRCWPHHQEKTARDRKAGRMGTRRERAP